MKIAATVETGPFVSAMRQLADKDVRWACADAMNVMVEEIHTDLVDRMDVTFDRPKPYTKKAFRVGKATERRQEAFVAQKDSGQYEGRDYLRVQERGGARPQTTIEKRLARALAYEGLIQSILPADNARLDAYGNWSRGEMNQVMSALKAQHDTASNMTDASWRRARKRRASYFVPKTGLTPGVYKKDAQGNLGVVAIFSEKVPDYRPRLGFRENAERLFNERMANHLAEKLAEKIARRFG